MRVGEDELLRWRETSIDPSALPARAADLVDAARDVPAPPPLVLARIFAHVADGNLRRPSRGRGLPIGLRLATLAVLLLMSVATAKGAIVLWQRYVGPIVVPIIRPMLPQRAAKLASTATPRKRAEAAPIIEAVEPEESRDVAEAAPPRPRRVSLPTRHASVAPVEAADPVNEAQLLADALGLLRQKHDPRGALALLDQYAQTYPHGVLASESRSARIEAFLKLDDRGGALTLLDERTTFAGRLGAEQLLTRAELRASVGRYADALGDFDRLLTPSGPQAASSIERALYGRAVTLGHLGRDQRARADLQDYQHRFPAGKNAAEVARLLQGGSR